MFNPFELASETFCYPSKARGYSQLTLSRVIQFRCVIGKIFLSHREPAKTSPGTNI